MQAWLELIPKNSKKRNREIYDINLPRIDQDFEYLPGFLSSIGIAGHGLNGLIPLSFQEIEAWSRMSRVYLTPFEADCIHSMSASYVSIANHPDSDCPIDGVRISIEQEAANIAAWKALCK